MEGASGGREEDKHPLPFGHTNMQKCASANGIAACKQGRVCSMVHRRRVRKEKLRKQTRTAIVGDAFFSCFFALAILRWSPASSKRKVSSRRRQSCTFGENLRRVYGSSTGF
jgi:hypothetical protein